jgi:hypothetical protein
MNLTKSSTIKHSDLAILVAHAYKRMTLALATIGLPRMTHYIRQVLWQCHMASRQ